MRILKIGEATILERLREVGRVPQGPRAKVARRTPQRSKVTVREINGIPVLCGIERIPRFRRGHRRKPRMAELGISKLKPQQRLALENKFELGMSNRQAAIQAGYEEANASHVLPRLLRRKPIVDELERKGVTDEKIAVVIAEGLDAMHPIRPDQPDHHARAKFVSEANKVKDNYPPKKIQVEDRSINIHLTKDDYLALRKYQELERKRK